jgi:hypothetical protein
LLCLNCFPPLYSNSLYSFMCHVSQHLLVFFFLYFLDRAFSSDAEGLNNKIHN